MNVESMDVLLCNLNSNESAESIPPWAKCIMDGMKEIISQLKGMSHKLELINTLQTEVANCKNTISELSIENERLNNQLLQITARVDDSEQRNRNYCLIAHGIKEDDSESTDDKVVELIQSIGVDITVDEIQRSHRLGPLRGNTRLRSSRQRPRPIIFRFVSFRKRQDVFRNKKKLKGKPVSITESLTKVRYDLYKEAVVKLGKGKVWTQEGRIMTKSGNEYIVINNYNDINDNRPDPEANAQDNTQS